MKKLLLRRLAVSSLAWLGDGFILHHQNNPAPLSGHTCARGTAHPTYCCQGDSMYRQLDCVRHDAKDQVFCRVIGDLVWLTRLENECVASLNRSSPIFVADEAAARNQTIKLPPCALGMRRKWSH